eukprot:TRINITY_DN9766_c1_g1_i2.p1 TRINITY_DN9766_c1_g1~~TRINITY_DN9766_c1_g1_i2.p1  ORF type:complete len:307 (-),score=68.03 TRINITY_DN9766_c1_g1_i2:350-1270(-)
MNCHHPPCHPYHQHPPSLGMNPQQIQSMIERSIHSLPTMETWNKILVIFLSNPHHLNELLKHLGILETTNPNSNSKFDSNSDSNSDPKGGFPVFVSSLLPSLFYSHARDVVVTLLSVRSVIPAIKFIDYLEDYETNSPNFSSPLPRPLATSSPTQLPPSSPPSLISRCARKPYSGGFISKVPELYSLVAQYFIDNLNYDYLLQLFQFLKERNREPQTATTITTVSDATTVSTTDSIAAATTATTTTNNNTTATTTPGITSDHEKSIPMSSSTNTTNSIGRGHFLDEDIYSKMIYVTSQTDLTVASN